MGRRTLALVLAAGALAAAGCGERAEPVGELEQQYPVTVQGAGDQPAVVAARPERIVALDAGSAELLVSLGVGERLVGAPAEAGVPGVAEVVRPTGQIDVEGVVKLEPDLVVATPSTDRVDVSRIERAAGAPVYVQPALSIEDVGRAALELGFLVGEPVAARLLAGELRRVATAVDERVAGTLTVTVFVDTGFFITVPAERSLLGELIRRANGENVAGNTAGLGPFDLRELRRLDPQVYLATSDSKTSLRSLARNPKTKNLTAVREGRVVVLPVELVTRAGPRIARAYAAVARALHPDAFG